ncbi:MAG: hypothetical protein PHQ45_03850 [Acidaminococcaceae bacterium]|nr:hypothetical protein [Acidaminococcaceae bacterium]
MAKFWQNKEIYKINMKQRGIIATFGIVLFMCMPGQIGWAADNTPEWVYQDILDLAAAGKVTLPTGIDKTNIHTLNRQQLSQLTAQAIQNTSGSPVGSSAPIMQPGTNGGAMTPELVQQWLKMNTELTQMENRMLKMQQDMRYLTMRIMAQQSGVQIPQQPVQRGSAVASPTMPVQERGQVAGQGMYPVAQAPVDERTASLQAEFTPELKNMGMGSDALAKETVMSATADEDKRAEEQDIKFNGEVRYSYRKNSGAERFQGRDSQLRVRLFARKRINDDWAAYGMLEGKKYFLSDYGDDDWASGSRLYVDGITGITKLTAGKFGYMMADGNIYDSDFKGVRASIDTYPWQYTFAAGRINSSADAILGTARYTGNNYDAGVGLYRFGDDDWGREKNSIFTVDGNYYFGDFRLGGTFLAADKSYKYLGSTGFVGVLSYRKLKSWRPGSYTLYARYYDQPYTTYRTHTMNGLADSMKGFRGYGVGLAYALFPEVVLTAEYYHLQDKFDDQWGNTLWSNVIYNF